MHTYRSKRPKQVMAANAGTHIHCSSPRPVLNLDQKHKNRKREKLLLGRDSWSHMSPNKLPYPHILTLQEPEQPLPRALSPDQRLQWQTRALTDTSSEYLGSKSPCQVKDGLFPRSHRKSTSPQIPNRRDLAQARVQWAKQGLKSSQTFVGARRWSWLSLASTPNPQG